MPELPEYLKLRSDFIRELVQRPASRSHADDKYKQPPPRTIVQFWHDQDDLPDDVRGCIASWERWAAMGFEHHLFDAHSAKAFIRKALGARYEAAFDRCYHPAMQADYFRLCFILAEGGFYVDADDVCLSEDINWLFHDGRLKIQPLCYDLAANAMVDTSRFLPVGAYESSWIFYVNNNPLVASEGHPIINLALSRATERLEVEGEGILPEIQETTGPGNLAASIFEFGSLEGGLDRALIVLKDWEQVAVSKWPLSYRNDARNWRLSNQQRIQAQNSVR